jgi:flavin reductase (DIM6/NTAB) family NADH-FMN oxidoreductase RutF
MSGRGDVAVPSRSVDGAAYRAFMSSFPTGIAVVTTMDAGGRPRGLTCSSLCGVSLAPPIMSVCLTTGSGTLRAVREHGSFGVNLLGVDGSAVARLFADSSLPHFDLVAWRRADGSGVPRLRDDVIGFAACRVVHTQVVGDHVMVFGEMVGSECGDGAPLLYGRRQFAPWPPAVATTG